MMNNLFKRNRNITSDQKKEIKENFEIFDKNKENKLEADDLKLAISTLGFFLSDEDIKRINKFYTMSRGEQSFYTYQEFNEIVSIRLSNKDSDRDNKKFYNHLTNNNETLINKQTLKSWADKLNEKLTEEEINELFKAADFDKDQVIGEKDFVKVLKRTQFY